MRVQNRYQHHKALISALKSVADGQTKTGENAGAAVSARDKIARSTQLMNLSGEEIVTPP